MNRSAGIGDPYWYEWGIGLLKAVEMLNPDSAIEAIAFQKDGVKGWDDVVVQYRAGHQDYYQVKHSRPRTNLTFSDLVGNSYDKPSLLRSLSSSWHEMNLHDSDSSCILITNRSAGMRGGISNTGIYYPSLTEFTTHISDQLRSVKRLTDIVVPEEWKDAFSLWLGELAPVSDDEKFRFLRALTISVDAPQLDEMRDRLVALLSLSFRITNQQANTLVSNLLAALFEWTTSVRGAKEWITAEDVMAALAESNPEVFGYCDVPTPVPFFSSREQAVLDISSLLTGDGKHRIVFLEAEPGAGKTSLVSRIVNQRAEDYSALVVDIRYYAYKPITPDAPTLPADADRSASPESLWYTLLSQLRERLRGRLLELGVPVRNHFIKPDEARNHVLRLSSMLAHEKGSPFVIVIDGIDHAARAQRKDLPSLLRSMPAPEIVPPGVRVLIAGQPASAFPEYPIWLRISNKMVERVTLGPVDVLDIQLLLSHSNTKIPQDYHQHAARIVQGVANGNTLATVFSVAEAEACVTLAAFEKRLSESRLHSGVHEYYSAIWRSAIKDSPTGIGAYLSSALCILRERITGKLLHEAFPDWGKPIPEWNAILKKLEPLIVYDEDGYRVRHNDLRVFLEQDLRSDETSMQRTASLLANYYMGASATPSFKQESLFSLLHLAGREQDKARIFSPEWVLNAAACGRELSTIYLEAEDAFRIIPEVRDFDIALSVACAGMTLTKLSDCLDAFPDLLVRTSMASPALPQCLETERYIPPFNQWNESAVRRVLSDAKMFVERGEINRATGLVKHWFSGVSPAKVVSEVKGIVDDHGFGTGPRMAIGADELFEDWGAIAFKLGIVVTIEECTDDIQQQATYHFEKGWATECIATSEPKDVLFALENFNPRYLRTFEVAIEKAATKNMWEVVADLLEIVGDERDSLSLEFRVKATCWALKAMGEESAKKWVEVLPSVRSGKWNNHAVEMPSMIFVARTIGWMEPHREASAIASELAEAVSSQGRNIRARSSLLLPLQAAAMIGLTERMLSKDNIDGAAALVPASSIQRVIELIWEHRHSLDFHEYRTQAMNLTFELIGLCQKIGSTHSDMILSLAINESERFPVDQKMPVLWEVLRRAGQRDRLRTWAEHWIGQDGAAWSGLGYSERAEIVTDFSRFCRDEGWANLAELAEDRLRHHVIGYSGHKEYAFQEPLDWVEELFRRDPSAWREEGLQLLEICQECDNQGGDNRLSSAIENEVASAAFRCGPNNAYAFFNWIDPEVERYWLQTVRSSLIGAGSNAIADRVIVECDDILAIWCCAVGLTRWFDRHQAQTVTALRDTILKAASPEQRAIVAAQLRALTPGEFLREEYDQEKPIPRSSEEMEASIVSEAEVIHAISELQRNVDEGNEPSMMEICHLAMCVARVNPANRIDLMSILFGLVGANRSYASCWDFKGRSQPLKELIPLIREDEIWELIRAAVRTTGDEFWLLSVPRNVHLICLYQALAEGTDRLRIGTQCIFGMHRLWSGLPARPTTFELENTSGTCVNTWPGFAATVLCSLLSSDSAETVSTALRGLCAVAEIAPQLVPALIDNNDGVVRSRLLLGAEVWAARHPMQVMAVINNLWSHRARLTLSDRIQLWICRLAVTPSENEIGLLESFIPQSPEDTGHFHIIPILTNQRRLLEIGPEKQGSLSLANAFSAARNWINRFGKITGCDTDKIEAAIAEELNSQSDTVKCASHKGRKKHFAAEDGDMIITCSVDSILNTVLERELCSPEWTDGDMGDVAIAVTHGDDPWVLRRSPLPLPKSFDWPGQNEVNEWLDTKTDTANVLKRLRVLAQGEDLSEDQKVIGSRLLIFTSKYDFEMWYWVEVRQPGVINARSAPSCPSGRSFQFFLPGRFEPQTFDRAPLVFFSRSLLCLSFSTLEVVPSRILQDRLGWHPRPQNPLEWTKEGQGIAKYEVYHGPLDYNWSRRHMRQPTLSRWVVKADELEKLGYLSSVWDHEIHPFRGE